ncbi:GTPase Der [Hirschfeldia incana]|nr:GTPase Der [Hirschfeldia incana]
MNKKPKTLSSVKMNEKRKSCSSLRRLFTFVFLLALVFLIGNAFITVDYNQGSISGWSSIIRLNLGKLKMCKTQVRPLGSETLPRGIVANTSDLELRPLWGAKRNKNPKQNLLAMAIGIKQKESVNKIVKKFSSSNEFVVMLFHYDGTVDEWKEFEWSETAIHVSVVNQTKWWFAKRFLHPDIVSAYSYIFLWDEDLGVDHFDAKRYVSIIREEGLEISQPALDPNLSEVHHQLTSRDSKSRVHRRTYKVIGKTRCNENSTGPPCTGFVEMMAPVFSKSAWRCAWHMIQNDLNHGWGIDFQLGYCAQGDRTKNIGIVDSEYILHLGLPTLGGSAENKMDSEQLDKTKTEDSSDKSKPSSTSQMSSARSEVKKQTYAELETFKHRWRNAVKNDECWIDRFQP